MTRTVKKQSGFTMVEMLATIILILLFTSIMALGISFATKTYADSITSSEVQVLKANLTTAINNELRFAGHVEVDAEGNVTKISSSEKNFAVNDRIDGENQGYGWLTYDLQSEDDLLTRNLLISADSYPKGVYVDKESFSITYKEIDMIEASGIDTISDNVKNVRGIFTVTLNITDGTETLATSTFQVKNHLAQVNDDADDT